MQQYRKVEIIVGLFVCVGIVAIAGLAIKLGQIGGLSTSGYTIDALFSDAGGIRTGGDVMLAGVSIGRVAAVSLKDNNDAYIQMEIDEGVGISTDAIASIRTKGIIGERYVRITQGADESTLADGDEVEDTESAINIEDLVSKYIFSPDNKD
ncbi:MAG: outer membrane lipid asymmetry maintenance protein MlaD [Mariprofundaceae bacterium]|nr:outer membrane lipid asymmetry maintenance protein MlaD [Mariprofundaceae bacterium]